MGGTTQTLWHSPISVSFLLVSRVRDALAVQVRRGIDDEGNREKVPSDRRDGGERAVNESKLRFQSLRWCVAFHARTRVEPPSSHSAANAEDIVGCHTGQSNAGRQRRSWSEPYRTWRSPSIFHAPKPWRRPWAGGGACPSSCYLPHLVLGTVTRRQRRCGMSARTGLARLVLQVLWDGQQVPVEDALQLRNWAVTPEDAMLPLEQIALHILREEENQNQRSA